MEPQAVNPYAAYGGAPIAPVSGGSDPYASYGGKAVTEAPSTPAAPPPDIYANPNNEGTYQMKTAAGLQAIPYSKVEQARQTPGHEFANPQEFARYSKDRAYDPKPHQFDGYVSPEVEQAKGALKNAAQVPNTIVGWLDSIANKAGEVTGTGSEKPLRPSVEKAENAIAPGITNPTHGGDQAAGGFFENVAEWLYGEGEARAGFEALTKSQQMAKVSKAAKFLEEHPVIAASLRTAAVGAGSGAQAAVHGATPGEAGEAAVTGAALGGAGEAISAGVGALRAGGAAHEAAAAGHAAAPEVLAQRTAAEGATRQAAAQQGVKDVVGRATNDAIERFNTGMAKVPGFTEAVAPAAPKTFAEGSQAIKDTVRPLYEKADAVAGYNGKLKPLMEEHKALLDSGDYAGAQKVESKIDGLLDERGPDITPAEQAAMKMGWRDAKVMDNLHAATESAFNGISEEMAAEPGASARRLKAGTKEGGSLQLNIGRVLSTPAKAKETYRVLGKDGVANLYRASHLVSNPEMAKATAALAEQVAQQFPKPVESNLHRVVGGAVGASVGAGVGEAVGGHVGAAAGAALGGTAGGLLSDGARNVMRKMVMSPRVGQLMDFAVRNNVNPKIAAAAVAAEIQREQGQPAQ